MDDCAEKVKKEVKNSVQITILLLRIKIPEQIYYINV